MLRCARNEQWHHIRWLLRATLDEPPSAHTRLAVALGLAACAQGRQPRFGQRQRLELAAAATARAADVEAAEGEVARGAWPPPEAAPWAVPALWARLFGLLGTHAAPDAEVTSEALSLLDRYRAAGFAPSAVQSLLVLRAAAAVPSLQDAATRLFEVTDAAERAAGRTASEEMCALVLPLYERAGRWRDALALPHVTPSSFAFSRALEEVCDTEEWLRLAESTRSLRWVGRREAFIRRWRDAALGAADGRGEAALTEALVGVLQLDVEDRQQRSFAAELARQMQRDDGVREGALPMGVAAKIAYRRAGDEALEGARALLRRAEARGATLDGAAYSALCTAHAAMGRDAEVTALAEAAAAKGVHLSPTAYLASSARSARRRRCARRSTRWWRRRGCAGCSATTTRPSPRSSRSPERSASAARGATRRRCARRRRMRSTSPSRPSS